MIGPLPTAPGGFNRVLVAIDKFTKWIEVKPVTCPKADRVLDFLDELVHHYGLPHRIITDLGSNFNNHQFWEYCENSGIDVRYVSVAHPRANGQVERTNGMVLDTLKKRLHNAANSKGVKWIKELPNALWGLRTQPSKPTGQSPYFLVYGSEAILPADVMWDSPAVEHYDEGVSEDSRRVDIDGLEEAHCAALVQSASTSRDVVINDVTLTSLKMPEWSQLVFCDDFVTILFWSLWWRHICSPVTKLVFPS
jgi:transposase InsO family protein